jgi:hypothetical protein
MDTALDNLGPLYHPHRNDNSREEEMKRITCPHCGMEFSPSEHTGAEAEKLLLFTAFWDAYPKKIQKPAAMRAWEKINPTEQLAAAITESVNIWKQNPACTDRHREV